MAQFLSAHGFLLRAPWEYSWHRNWLSPEQVIQKRASRKQQSFPGGSAGKESACNAGDLGLIPGLKRSPGEGNPLQYSGLENFMDCTVHEVTRSWTQLSDFHFISLQETAVPIVIIPDLVSEVKPSHLLHFIQEKWASKSSPHSEENVSSLKEVKCQRICGFFFFTNLVSRNGIYLQIFMNIL